MTQVIEVSLDDAGRIFIPPALQRRLGLSVGMTLIVEENEDDGIRLQVKSESPVLVDKEGILVVRAESRGDLTDITRRERERQFADRIVSP